MDIQPVEKNAIGKPHKMHGTNGSIVGIVSYHN